MSVFPKFIVEDDSLIIAKCNYHKQLVHNPENVKGGGMWHYNNETKTFTLSGASHDFGAASIEDIKICIKNDKVYTDIYFEESIKDKYNFYYNNYGELINLKE